MLHTASSQFTSGPALSAEGSWSFPPTSQDARLFGVTRAGAACDPLELDETEMALIDALKQVPSTVDEASDASGTDPVMALKAMRRLSDLGYIEDMSPGAAERSRSWKGLCLETAAAAVTVGAISGSMPISKIKPVHIKAMFEGRPIAEVSAALANARIRGLLGADEATSSMRRQTRVVSGRAVPDAAASEAAVAEGSPETPARQRRARGTAPVSSWTRRKFKMLAGMLKDPEGTWELPDLEVDAKKTVRAMETEITKRDPEALTRATVKQMSLIDTLVDELAASHGVVHPAPGGEMAKAEALEFISRWIDLRPASSRQVEYAKGIGEALGLEIPVSEGRYLYSQISRFIFDNRAAYQKLQEAKAA